MRDSLRSLLFSSLTLLAAASAAAEDVSPQTRMENQPLPTPKMVRISAERNVARVIPRIAGRGLNIGELNLQPVNADGRQLVWREVQRDHDQLGGLHITYKQYLVGNGVDAELYGSGMALHYEKGGNLAFVDGAQFESVKLGNSVKLSRGDVARSALQKLRIFAREGAGRDSEIAAEGREARAELKLVQFGDEFRFAYFTGAVDGNGMPHRLIIDAETDQVLARGVNAAGSNCSPSAGTLDSAYSIPVRYNDGVPMRTGIKATIPTSRVFPPGGYTHEGTWLYSGIKMTVYNHILENTSTASTNAWKCNTSSTYSYTTFPLYSDTPGGTPIYKDRPGPDPDRAWAGSAAGDALWHTYQTMRTFVGFGRAGWNNSNGPANITIDKFYSNDLDRGIFKNGDGITEPATGVVFGAPDRFYSLTASLDAVAHEWGHGVIFSAVGWPYVGATEDVQALHEGFSDVIGMIVEKRRQPSGYGLEKRDDWDMHEDAGTSGYARSASDDGASHTWTGPNGSRQYNDKVHKNDTTGTGTIPFGPHGTGNMLNVVHRLMSDGGVNPAYSRLGLTAPFTIGIGSSKAGLILFQALQYRIRSWHGWDDLRDLVKQEAFNQYNTCSYDPLAANANAENEQMAVINAFANIGYPATAGTVIPCE
jgi:hypothetical protein